jgi:uncharacterized Zn finger protein
LKLKDITEDDIYALVGHTLAGRGFDYYESGRVLNLKVRNGKIIAEVAGNYEPSYTVKIWCDEDGVDGNCTCAYSQGIDVCKHVAAVLFEWVYNRAAQMEGSAVEEAKLRQDLGCLSKEDLISLLIEAIEENDSLYQKIRVLTETVEADAEKNWIREMKAQIQRICSTNPFTDWEDDGIGGQLQNVLEPLEDAQTKEKLEVYAYTFEQIQRVDVDFHTDDLYDFADGLCEKMGRLLGGADFSHEAKQKYLDLLVKTYFDSEGWLDNELEEAIAKACALPEDIDYVIEQVEAYDADGKEDLLAKLYLQAGREDAYLQIRLRNLDSDLNYLEVAEFYLNRDEQRKAIEIAEEGMKKLAHKAALYPFLEEQYEAAGDIPKLQKLFMSQFEEFPSLELYQRLKNSHVAAGIWDAALRRKIITILKRGRAYGADVLLAQIYILEEDYDAAISLTQESISEQALGCVAEGVAKIYPEKSIAIYKQLVNDFLAVNGRERYRIAAGFAAKIKEIYISVLGGEEAWNNYIRGVRFENRRRPALIDEFKKL